MEEIKKEFIYFTFSTQVLIGFNRGLIVLWNTKDGAAEATFNATQVRIFKSFVPAHI